MRPARTFYFLYYAALAALMPYLAIYFASRGLSGLEIGILTSILPLVTMVGELLQTKHSVPVKTGIFGAMMNIELNNDGPVTLLLERD